MTFQHNCSHRNARICGIAALTAVACASLSTAHAQPTEVPGFALNAFDPSVPGDAFFGVSSPMIGGHWTPRATVIFDYGHRPFQYNKAINDRNVVTDIVASQGFLRVDASLALWNRVLASVDLPFAVVNAGKNPNNETVDLHAPSGPAMGDVRIGLRGCFWGDFRDPFQVGLGANLYLPTGSSDAYAGEGHVRSAFQLLLGGRAGSGVGFVWSASGGAMIRVGDVPFATFGGGAALVLGEDRLQVGPEVYGSVAIGGDRYPLPRDIFGTLGSSAEIEILGGARVRLVGGLFLGVAVGTSPTPAIGAPALRVVSSLGWTPLPGVHAPKKITIGDRDGDGIRDDIDACPNERGEIQSDPTKDGCPFADKDHDAVLDVDDACPSDSGARNPDPTKNGCPPDADDDGVPDGADACAAEPGLKNADPARNGCPPDRDGDGVPDSADGCPDAAGIKNPDPRQNGCPDDPDGDGIKGAADACPLEKGLPDPDLKKNGCPKFVRMATSEITIAAQIEFNPYGKHRSETVAPVSTDLMNEIRDVIAQHPEITKIEVQGHTDDVGTQEFNQRLSQERADAVRQWLIEAGIPEGKLIAKGYGFWKPRADNRINVGRRMNRRVQFVILERKN